MQKLIITVLISFAISMVAGPFIIPWLKRLKVGQTINQFGPRSHQGKQGTATMGGLVFIFSAVITSVIMGVWKGTSGHFLIIELLSMLAFACIGFADDYIKVVKRRSLGLTPIQKMVPQALIALLLSVFAYMNPYIGSELVIPFTDSTINLGIFYIPVMVFVIVGVVNSANLLDGLDGLCAGNSMLGFGAFSLIAMSLAAMNEGLDPDLYNTALFSGAMCGAILGFLRFNTHPASVFMGDVGSFAIG
ncbi:MAG: phospho-N-acetylmuramoyl-pentapeptide-transferase, partial [Clostridia bacterium]|nr:phospho-N-acetylmuramoyl-pentapeptide-transferase [Clostridia bacterium]